MWSMLQGQCDRLSTLHATHSTLVYYSSLTSKTISHRHRSPQHHAGSAADGMRSRMHRVARRAAHVCTQYAQERCYETTTTNYPARLAERRLVVPLTNSLRPAYSRCTLASLGVSSLSPETSEGAA